MNAQVVIPDKFWIVTDKYGKVGTLRACDDGFEFFDNRNNKTTILESFDEFEQADKQQIETDMFTVNGFPTRYKKGVVVEHEKLPLFKKSESSKTIQAAGFYAIKTDTAGWLNWSCPKIETLEKHPYSGPFMSEWEANHEIQRLKN